MKLLKKISVLTALLIAMNSSGVGNMSTATTTGTDITIGQILFANTKGKIMEKYKSVQSEYVELGYKKALEFSNATMDYDQDVEGNCYLQSGKYKYLKNGDLYSKHLAAYPDHYGYRYDLIDGSMIAYEEIVSSEKKDSKIIVDTKSEHGYMARYVLDEKTYAVLEQVRYLEDGSEFFRGVHTYDVEVPELATNILNHAKEVENPKESHTTKVIYNPGSKGERVYSETTIVGDAISPEFIFSDYGFYDDKEATVPCDGQEALETKEDLNIYAHYEVAYY